MPKRAYAVMGATGKIGSVLTGELLKRGHEVRAIARDAAKLDALKKKGAVPFSSAFDNSAALAEAFRGAAGVFTMIPPDYAADDFGASQDRVGKATIDAIRKTGVTHVVDLSSVGAERPDGTGPIKGLHRQEKRLDAISGLQVVHLRPMSFMENQFFAIPVIKGQGVNGSPTPGNVPIPFIATADIGRKAAELLDVLTFPSKVVDLVGPKAVTLDEFTTALGKALGNPALKYVQFSFDDTRKAMLALGMKPGMVDLMIEMHKAGNEGGLMPTGRPVPGTTTVEDFAKTFAEIYRRT